MILRFSLGCLVDCWIVTALLTTNKHASSGVGIVHILYLHWGVQISRDSLQILDLLSLKGVARRVNRGLKTASPASEGRESMIIRFNHRQQATLRKSILLQQRVEGSVSKPKKTRVPRTSWIVVSSLTTSSKTYVKLFLRTAKLTQTSILLMDVRTRDQLLRDQLPHDLLLRQQLFGRSTGGKSTIFKSIVSDVNSTTEINFSWMLDLHDG